MPGDPHFKEKHFRAARSVVGNAVHREEGNVIEPVCPCMIVTENGQVWTIELSAFVASKARVHDLWDTQPSLFTRQAA